MEIYKEYQHNPPHLFMPNRKYFITISTLGKFHYLKSDSSKKAAYDYLLKSINNFNWEVEDWVILNNHIHIMLNSPENATTLPKLMNNFYKFTANWLSKHGIKKIDIKYFHNYWDTCITYEKSYYARLNYIWFNPVKHGYVDSPEKWKFGSYFFRYRHEIKDIKLLMEKYPFDKVKIYDEF